MTVLVKKKLKLKPKTPVVVPVSSPTHATSLHEIMDKSRTFNIIYSGVENEKYFQVLYDMGIKHFLMSFHYIQNRKIDMKSQYKDKSELKFFIDSGAHTYLQDEQYAEMSVEYWETHLKKYLAWAEENRDMIFAIANFDFEQLVGTEVVKRWNRQYFEPFMLRTGIPVCFVWHQISSETWDKYCERYPYVGFSSVNIENNEAIDLQEYMSKLKVAEKYNTLVHGFGMTRTSMLTKLPFYTSDSTTWMVGLQYGEINYWTGRKMTRLKKDKWKGEYLQKILELGGIDKKKLLDEENFELIKANMHAFIEAEKYIQTRLKANMYWLKPKVNKVSDIATIEYPDLAWCMGETNFSDIEAYAKKLNINPEHPDRDWMINSVVDCTFFMNWDNEEYEGKPQSTYLDDPQVLTEVHEAYINSIRDSNEEKIADIVEFFTRVVKGEEQRLLHSGTNFDREIKEREDYLEEDNFEYADISERDIQARLSNLLPAPGSRAPEIDELDDELFGQIDVVPIRDANGRFIKGQTKIRKPKAIYSSKYPKLACDTCYVASRCDKFKAGYACAYNKMFKRFDTRDMGDIVEAMQSMVGLNLERMQRVAIFEMLDGGMLDGNLTGMINQNMALLDKLKSMYEYGSPEVMRHTKIVKADGTLEEVTSITNPQEGSFLEKLFAKRAHVPDPLDDEPIEKKNNYAVVEEE